MEMPRNIVKDRKMNVSSTLQLAGGISIASDGTQVVRTYRFRHKALGELGRLVLQPDGHCIACEWLGEQDDPMTAKRAAYMALLKRDIAHILANAAQQVVQTKGDTKQEASLASPAYHSLPLACMDCGTVAALLIYAPEASNIGHLEDCARQMFSCYSSLNVPTWVLAANANETSDRLISSVKVWPLREPAQQIAYAHFHEFVHQLAMHHCQAPNAGH